MPQEPRFTTTPPPTSQITQSSEDNLDRLRKAQLETSLKPSPIRANTGSRKQEHSNSGAQPETGIRTEQLLAFGAAEEEAVTTVQTARYDEASEAKFRQILQEERRDRPATSSMEIADIYNRSNDGTMSTEHTSTVTPSKPSTQNLKSYSHGTDETGTAEHTSFAPSNTDGTSLPDVVEVIEEDPEVIEEYPLSNLPAQADITLDYIFAPPTPPTILDQINRFADNSDVTVTEEEHSNFDRQPLEARRHTFKVFFKEFTSKGLSDQLLNEEEVALNQIQQLLT